MDIFNNIEKIDMLIREKSSNKHGFSIIEREAGEAVFRNPEICNQIVRLLIYYIGPEDYKSLKDYLDDHDVGKSKFSVNIDHLYKEKDLALNKIEYTLLSSTQKLLIATYLIFHCMAGKGEVLKDEGLMNILEVLGIADDYIRLVIENAGHFLSNTAMSRRSIIECVIEPVYEVEEWALELVYSAYNNGSFIKREILYALNPVDYEHPTDKQALNALEGTPGLETLIRKFHQYGLDKQLKIQFTGSNIRITAENLPRLHNAVVAVCETIHLQNVPDCYIMQGDDINAFTAGVERPILVISEGCAEKLTYDELVFVIGHEIGHIKSQHVLYHQMANVLPALGSLIGSMTLGFGELLSTGIQLALLNWQRKSEFTSDRAGLLACQNIDAAITAMMKIAGYPPSYYSTINPKDFLHQAKEFEGYDEDNLDRIAKILSVMNSTHPWTVMRVAEMNKWIEVGRYADILKKYNRSKRIAVTKQSALTNGQPSFCRQCGTKINGNKSFCMNCGAKI